MNLQEIVLSARKCAEYINVNPETITRMCRLETIKAYRCSQKSHWHIVAYDFADFLYKNPKYAEQYRNISVGAYGTLLKENIFAEIDSRPILYSGGDIMRLFDVTTQSVHNWVGGGILIPVGKSSYRTYLFSTESIVNGIIKSHYLFNRLIESQADLSDYQKLQDLRAICLREGFKNGKKVSKNYA